MKFLSDILAKAGLTVDGVVTLNNTATGQTPDANDNSTKLATTAWVRTFVQPYSLPIASASTLGGIKVGNGLSIDGTTGVLSTVGGGAVTSFRSEYIITATAGQTVFTVPNGYTPNKIDLFLNGVYLNDYTYTATDSSTVVLNDGALLDDKLTIFVYSTYYVGDSPSARTTTYFTATDNQTTFTVDYVLGQVDIFYNGSKLEPEEYIANNGTSIILATPCNAGDKIEVVNWATGGGIANTRTITINGITYDLSANRTWTLTTSNIAEGTNLYYTNARSRAAISLTVTGTSGASTYDSNTGVLNVPTYTLAGLNGVPTNRTLTIDGVSYDLSANRTWNILPTGGAAGDILAKVSGTNYDVTWIPNYTSTVQHTVKAAVAVTKGQAVYISSADGTNMIVSKASNASEGTSSKTLGLVAQDLAINGQGFVVTEGLLAGLDTSTAQAGDPVWLGTNGNLIFGLLNKPTAPAHLVFIGIVTRVQQNNGEIFVKVQNGFELDELHNLSVASPSDGDMIKYVASTGLWTKIAATTTNITEGINLYYTQARFDTAFAAKSTTNLTEGTNLYYTTARVNSDFDTRLATKSTTNLAEGTNLYYTDTRVGTYLTANSYATQSYVSTQINNLVSGAPGLLDTLDELAAALGDDPNFATTVSTALSNRLRIDIGTQGLTSTQQGYGRTNLGLGSLATLSSVANANITDLAYSKLTGVPSTFAPSAHTHVWTDITDRPTNLSAFTNGPGYLTGITSSQVTTALGYTPYNSTNPSGYITSYTETDTLANVTGRGNTTSSALYLSGAVNVYNTDSNDFRLYYQGAASGSARIYYHQPTNQLRIYATAITTDATSGIGSLVLYDGSAYKVVLTEATVGSYALLLSGGTVTGTAVINGGAAHPLAISSGQRYQLQIRNTNNSTNSGYGWWWFMDTNFNMGFHADGASDRFTLTRDGNLSISGTLSASGYNKTNWDTAYGWGNHASAGYITSSASITGNAANITGAQIMNTSAVAENDAFPGYNQTASYIVTSSTGGGDGYIQSWRWTGGGYVTQFYTDVDPTGIFALRHRDGAGSWGSWYRLLHSGNYTSYSPSLTGSGASGTWGINITGSAGSASSASSAGTITGRYRGTFTVGGNTSTFYPVAFQIGSGSTGEQGISVLQIERGGYDEPGYSNYTFSTFHCRIRAKADGWGFGASYVQVEANAYTTPMLADITQQNQTSQLIVWLRGGCAYRWYDVEGGWGLNFSNGDGTSYTTFNGNSVYSPTSSNTIGGNFKYQQGWGNNYIGGTFTAGGDVVAYSDARVKENIRPIHNVLDRICNSRGVLYDRIDNESKDNIGFIAQELEQNFPELVTTDGDRKSVKYQNAAAVLFEAVKELKAENDALKEILKRNNII